ncbi:DUF3732 domain-containing protein [Aeromonas salmonicida]
MAISVYGNNHERRDVVFKTSEVNIITGKSKTGKSSLIDIVEYCLGSNECTVADGHIRKTVAWYAVLLKFPDSQVFIARAAPKVGFQSNTSCHLLVGSEITIPSFYDLTPSTNISSVVDFLTRKIGIAEQVTEVPKEQTRSSIQIGFKHSKFYLFQGQDEVAAKRILFHRQAEPYIPQAIKDTLPYFMGAADDNRLSELEHLRSLKRELAKLNKQIIEIDSIRGEGLKKGYELLAESLSVGLYNGDLSISDNELLQVLNNISKWTPSKQIENEVERNGENDTLYSLNESYQNLIERKRIVRSRIRSATDYASSSVGFENELNEQSLRLQSIELFNSFTARDSCPICESTHQHESNTEQILRHSIEKLSNRLDGVTRNKPRITSYLNSLRDEDRNLADKSRKLRTAIEAIRKKDNEILSKEMLDSKKSRSAGRISLYLESIEVNSNTNELKIKKQQLNAEISFYEKKLDPQSLKETLEAQLSCISEDMTKWARFLELEHSENPIRLDITNLTVSAETPYGRTPLYRMGSGENWVGYHLVTYLALAKWFIQQNRPVGRFIFFDQPTQVYFPSEQAMTGNINEIIKDEDRNAVRKMFKWIFDIVAMLSPDLQVIITDHADIDEDWFQQAVVDEKWRQGTALIPSHWYK